MISTQYKNLAQQIMAFAKQNGCSASRISIGSGTESSFGYRDTQLEQLQQSSSNQLSVALFVDGRYGSYSTNRMDKDEVEKFIKNAIDATRYLAEDANRTLPAANRYYTGADAPDTCYDNTLAQLPPDDKLNLAKATVEEVYNTHPRIISVAADYYDSEWFSYLIDSNGFEGERAQTAIEISASVSLKGDGDARPESWWYDSTLFWDKLQKEGIGKKALERALRKIGQEKIKSGKYTMVVDNMNIGNLLSPVISALSGGSLAQKDSFLIDKLGKKIAGTQLTLTDEPHIDRARGSRWFDNEGVATKRRAVIDNGVLQTYFIDTYNANRLKMEPTISGASLLTFRTGTKDLDGLVGSVGKGILVTGFNGGNSNSATGDFSFGVEGFLIENGKPVKPVSEMNVTGNLLTLWGNLAEVGNDPRTNASWRTPSLLFDDVSFSGL
jgi:PmbA protein